MRRCAYSANLHCHAVVLVLLSACQHPLSGLTQLLLCGGAEHAYWMVPKLSTDPIFSTLT